jgi:hypothetical protein
MAGWLHPSSLSSKGMSCKTRPVGGIVDTDMAESLEMCYEMLWEKRPVMVVKESMCFALSRHKLKHNEQFAEGVLHDVQLRYLPTGRSVARRS